MSDHRTLPPGDWVTYGTNLFGVAGQLTVQGPGKGKGTARVKYRYVLCCFDDIEVVVTGEEVKFIDVSDAHGALLNVRNVGIEDCTVWTDG